jgi:hypothetical protein
VRASKLPAAAARLGAAVRDRVPARASRGRQKVIPPAWERRAYSLEPKVIHALEIRAARERVPVSVLINRILKAEVRSGEGMS